MILRQTYGHTRHTQETYVDTCLRKSGTGTRATKILTHFLLKVSCVPLKFGTQVLIRFLLRASCLRFERP